MYDNVKNVTITYHIKKKRMTKHTPFRLVYGKEAVMPLEFEFEPPSRARDSYD
jgi:hypothetical protein